MKQYESGDWGILFIFNCQGSVIPKTFKWAFPAALLAVVINFLAHGVIWPSMTVELEFPNDYKDMAQLWVGFSFMIGFLITFRTATAYNRWWEGATLLQQARGEWVNAYSNCIAFCTDNPVKQGDVRKFREYFAFLMSLLFSAALNAITQAENDFETLKLLELPDEATNYLHQCSDPVEVIMLWIQTLVVQNSRTSVIDVPPPVLTRVFQELSRGVVNINNIRKIAVLLFPFPYAQLIGALLIFFTALTPIITGVILESVVNAFVLTFTSVFSLVAINFVAMEIECPFGTDPNDLPMQAYQDYMNRTLELLLEEQAYSVPPMDFTKRGHVEARPDRSSKMSLAEPQDYARNRRSINSNTNRKADFTSKQKLHATQPLAGNGRRDGKNELPGKDVKTENGVEFDDARDVGKPHERQSTPESQCSSHSLGPLEPLDSIPEDQPILEEKPIPQEKPTLLDQPILDCPSEPPSDYPVSESPKLSAKFHGFGGTSTGSTRKDCNVKETGSSFVHFQGFRPAAMKIPPAPATAESSSHGSFQDMFNHYGVDMFNGKEPQRREMEAIPENARWQN